MERFAPRNVVLALDLDDTLYKEDDYEVSGVQAVSELAADLYGKEIRSALLSCRILDNRDWLASACELIGVPPPVKEELLWAYRLHRPAIRLDETVSRIVRHFDSVCAKLVILTDGRSVTQRLKLKALGLDDHPIYISEEYGLEKPNPARFVQVMRHYPGKSYVYVGDDPAKDFVAPNSLGWRTFGLRGDDRNVHTQSCDALPNDYLPNVWINSLKELLDYIC